MIQKALNLNPELKDALEVISKKLVADQGYYNAWRNSLAKAFHDKIEQWADGVGLTDTIAPHLYESETSLLDICTSAADEYIKEFIKENKSSD